MFVVMAKEYNDDDEVYVYPAKLYELKWQAEKFIKQNEYSFADYDLVEMEVEKNESN